MKWPVKVKDPCSVGVSRWVKRFALLPVRTKTHWVWLEKYGQLQVSVTCHSYFWDCPVYFYVDSGGIESRILSISEGNNENTN